MTTEGGRAERVRKGAGNRGRGGGRKNDRRADLELVAGGEEKERSAGGLGSFDGPRRGTLQLF